MRLDAGPDGWLARARVRTLRGRYAEALADVERAGPAGSAALEVGAWAAYFGRDFAQAAQFAEDGALTADDPATRARCLAVGGRTHHAAGDLAQAELMLGEAFSLAEGADRVAAAGWLGVLRAHQSRVEEALALLRPAARGQIGVEHTSATMHSLLFTGHAHALAGRPVQALDALARYTAEVERRQVPRFAGRAVNFTGWVLRNLGAWPEALDHHEALEAGQGQGTADVTIAALEDLAEQCLATGDPDGARARLAQASALLQGNLVFGWRLRLKHQLLTGRLALLAGDAEQALAQARELEARRGRAGGAALHQRGPAARAPGEPRARRANPDAVAADLDLLDSAAAIEAWWWTCDLAADFAQPAWRDRAADRAARLARGAGGYADGLLAAADRRLAATDQRPGQPAVSTTIETTNGPFGVAPEMSIGHGPFGRAPRRGPPGQVEQAQERCVGHAQPPGHQLGGGGQAGRDGDGAHPDAGEPGGGRARGQDIGVARPASRAPRASYQSGGW